ncbi:hypothetical protein M422DRAFT_28673 [Sphaerobolus stellatus SS14]|uniref:Uncharacterized protein n=1 Tax=Sphaerobolus stellatus (strain SS14) TaxID=990650 RepID=A0A0C9W4N3_SPHS4|nr:hypothetical protein M422DRAFT_28673 [Sphaerobolus stellatus SS14]
MSIMGNKRPRIPAAFISPKWNPSSTKATTTAAEFIDDDTTPRPTQTTFPPTSYVPYHSRDSSNSTNYSSSDADSEPITPTLVEFSGPQLRGVDSKAMQEKDALDALKGLQIRRVAQRRAQKKLERERTRQYGDENDEFYEPALSSSSSSSSLSSLDAPLTTPPAPSKHHDLLAPFAPKSRNNVFKEPMPPSPTSLNTFSASSDPVPSANSNHLTTAASLRSIRTTFRRLQDSHKASQRLGRDKISVVAGITGNFKTDAGTEEILLRLADQHREAMIQICEAEERAYEGRWRKLRSLRIQAEQKDVKGTERGLKFHQIPWPILTPIVFSPVEINKKSVEGFVLSPFRRLGASEREKVAEEIKKWEEGVFEELVVRKVVEREKESVREGRRKVREVLEAFLNSECMKE